MPANNNIPITPSLQKIIFGLNDFQRHKALDRASRLVTAYNVCIFYAEILQAYYFALSINTDGSLQSVMPNVSAYHAVKDIWLGTERFEGFGRNNDNMGSVFSFLQLFKGDSNVAGENMAQELEKVSKIYRRAVKENNYKAFTKYDEDGKDLIGLIESFKLLEHTELNKDKLIFNTNNKIVSISCKPFITFVDDKGVICSPEEGESVYLLASVKKGTRNNELLVETVELNFSQLSERQIFFSVAKYRDLYYMLENLGISAEWYNETNIRITANYDFLINLKNCTANAVFRYLRDKNKKLPNENQGKYWNQFKRLFDRHDVKILLPAEREKLTENEEDIGDVLLGLFLENGATLIVTTLLLVADDFDTYTLNFSDYLDSFVKFNCITAEDKEKMIAECNEKIKYHCEQLKGIVEEGTEGYKKRSREIKAEQRAYYILQAAGIQKETLFADVETIRSIDDYYDMLHNTNVPVEDSLKEIFTFLNGFYRLLLEFPKEAEEGAKKEFFNTCIANLRDLTATQLIKEFIAYSERNVNCARLKECVGRDKIISYPEAMADLCDSIDEMLYSGGSGNAEVEMSGNFFISYSHDDIEKVDEIISAIEDKQLNVSLYIDRDKFRSGENWFVKAMNAMSAPECKGLIVFMSRSAALSEPVAKELTYFLEEYGDDTNDKKDIIIVNLEEDGISSYISKLQHEEWKKMSRGEKYCNKIDKMAEIFDKDVIYRGLYDKHGSVRKQACVDEIIGDIRKAVKSAEQREKSRIRLSNLPAQKQEIANLYAILKTGKFASRGQKELDDIFSDKYYDLSACIYPIVMSLKEIRIKRDNVTMMGYEIITRKEQENSPIRYMITSDKVESEEYYCVPHQQNAGKYCNWMINPVLLKYSIFDGMKDKHGQ